MRQLIGLLVIVVVAVGITLLAQSNDAKVLVFAGQYRVDMSLNFVIIALLVGFALLYLALRALSASSQLPSRLKAYLKNRKQEALLKANTRGLISLITGDEHGAEKALKQAVGTGIESDLSYMIRAMSAIQADRLDEAEQVLAHEKAINGEHNQALLVLKCQVALAKGQHATVLNIIEGMDPMVSRLPQVVKLRLLALVGLQRWQEALDQYRVCVQLPALGQGEKLDCMAQIYQGLCEQAHGDAQKMSEVLSAAKPAELAHVAVLRAMASGLLRCGLHDAARTMLQTALDQEYKPELLPVYHEVAVLQAREALPFVEKLVAAHPNELRLLELAADVCEQEQLWGKAIARFEAVYNQLPSAHVAGRLERLYQAANQGERAKQWRDKMNMHLQKPRQPA
ncbi:heme biosynthesis HemY N-terminal domain-containing protein [Limnobacter sp.]|uniref:heme biosynthesis HemY N-terminal domain-containing protein n=1 Tax=Limnobacter sp. TaxID=2003368 RepID=UPI00351237C4